MMVFDNNSRYDPSNFIFEFDTLDELRKFDSSYATSFDSIAYTAACYSYKKLEENEHPHKLVSLLWCILLIVLPIALVFSESSMNNIQSISIISAFPIGIIMIIMIWGFIKDIKIYMKKELKGKEWQNN